MGKVPRGHAARQSSKKHIIKAGQSLSGLSSAPKFYQQSGKRTTVPKGKK